MNPVGQAAALIAALIHVLIWAMESFLFTQRRVHGRFHVRDADVEAVRPWAYNQGFYNMFLAVGTVVGLVLLHKGGYHQAGQALVALACASMVAAALILIGTDRRMARGALLQGVMPLIALVLLVFG